ncbi:hypothetical protein SAMN05421678_102499 [Actinopolymorpha cephalotaxi]|uniref:Uncharacterized protein n=1 Tax=Actinopolymorpha cephalotaxi TaxID=504797 RepID=A0A1I2MEG4_9ACTN|nr:DUF6247 family protein [Actinopolymorpha cephalotaxi]NYH81636.1 hypothetical protein [Actinopolymorpha cephalotaxi]SFF87766.1 hypothetical protein SAMN05421678_102499 [Actinopolymorpha cephalotaxi]
MSAEPIHEVGYDPAEILRVLPEEWHAQFLGEYHSALDAAHEIWRFKQLQELLRVWRLHAAAVSNPAFEQAERAVRENRRDEFVSMDEAFPGWADER